MMKSWLHMIIALTTDNANVELTREGMGKNVTQPKGDSIQVENRSNNYKKCVVTPTFWLILGVKTCQTHGWRKTKKTKEPRDH